MLWLLCPNINLFGQCMTRPYKRACHQTNFSEGGFVKKDPLSFFFFFSFFKFSLFPGHFLAFFSLHFLKRGGSRVGSLAGGGSPANIGKMRWCVRSFDCRYELSIKIFILCGTVRYASKNDKMNIYSHPNVDIMPSKCCMHLVACLNCWLT